MEHLPQERIFTFLLILLIVAAAIPALALFLVLGWGWRLWTSTTSRLLSFAFRNAAILGVAPQER